MHPTAKVSEQVNKKCPTGNTILQPSGPFTDPIEGLAFEFYNTTQYGYLLNLLNTYLSTPYVHKIPTY